METIENETMNIAAGTVAEQVEIKSEYVALRDINIQSAPSAAAFHKVKVERYSEELYIAPSFSNKALEKATTSRCLIFQGGMGFDSSSFLRHIAWKVSQSAHASNIYEFDRGLEEENLLQRLRKEEIEEAICILDELHPKHFNYDLQALLRWARESNSILITSSQAKKETWKLSEEAIEPCWLSMPSGAIYANEQLARAFLEQLRKHWTVMPFRPASMPIESSFELAPEVSIALLAHRFHSPEQIDLFVQQLTSLETKPTSEELNMLVQKTIDDEQPLVIKWFLSLAAREKLIVMGASLMDGVLDDQFFSIMQDIVASNWQYQDPSLLALDYCDLDFANGFLELHRSEAQTSILQSRYTDQRTHVLLASWDGYRRHMLHALAILVDAARNTIVGSETNWEKYGTMQRRMALRKAIGETISDIGMLSLETVEHALLEFASVSEETLQRITAKALARWRAFGREELLFETLERWSEDEAIQNLVNEFLKSEKIATFNKKSSTKSISYIKATTVLCLGYAASYDAPEQLDGRIIDLLSKMASEDDPLVRSRLKQVLPKAIQNHPGRLTETMVRDFIIHDDLQDLVAEGLAAAYEYHPATIKRTLEFWKKECLNSASENNQRNKFTYRDKVLITVLKIYRLIPYDFLSGSESNISFEEVKSLLKLLLEREQRKTVRFEVFETLGHLLKLDFSAAQELVGTTFSTPYSPDSLQFVNLLAEIYLSQREQLQNAPLEMQIGSLVLPTWVDRHKRPLTAIELHLNQWIISDQIPLRQMALAAFWEFAKLLDRDETEALANYWSSQSSRPQPSSISQAETTSSVVARSLPFYQPIPSISLRKRIWIYLLCFRDPGASSNRARLKAMYQMLLFKGYDTPYTLILFQRLRRGSGDQQKMAKRLAFLR